MTGAPLARGARAFIGVLLRLYPASFRTEYGADIRAMFARRWRQTATVAARATLCIDAVADAVRNAPLVHWDILRQDVVFALRAMRRAPALGFTVILVTAIGIGATTAAFSLADHVLLKPLPFRDPERLVKIWQLPRGGGRLEASPANFRDWKEEVSAYESVGAFNAYSANLVGAGDPLRLDGSSVSGELFGVLGVSALIGRTIVPADDRVSAPATVVISERLWRTRFAADPAVIGTTVVLNDAVRVVVGVMPRTFEFPTRTVDFWIPFQFAPEAWVYFNPYLQIVARLKPGVSRAQALAETRKLTEEIARRISRDPDGGRMSANVIGMRDELLPQSRMLLWGLLAASGALLIIACTNLASLLLTRGLARQKELALRAALGAGRHRMLRQMLTENLLLAGVGGVAGVALAAAYVPTLARLVPSGLPISDIPGIDVRLLSMALAVTMASAIGFGLVPALRTLQHADAAALREGARGGSSRRTERVRGMLVIAQVGASVLLLVASGLLLRALLRVQQIDPGFRTEGVVTARTALPLPKYEAVAVRHQFFDRVLGDVRALPGVSNAAYITGLPMLMRGMIWTVSLPGREQLSEFRATVSLRFVTPGFFATMGIPLRAGRDVADSDTQNSLPVAVVSQSFVDRYWPGQNPIGRRFAALGALRGERIVVGVVGNILWRALERNSEPQLYLPSQQVDDGAMVNHMPKELVVKSSLPPASLVPAIRAIVARADPQQPVSDVQRLSDVLDGETAPRRVQVRVLGAFAAIAFLLTAIGLHGLLAYNVSQRAREIGVRLALGAQRRSILAIVMQRGLALAAAGVVIGAALALVAGRLLQTLLAGVSPTDVVTFAAAVGLSVLMTIAGSLLPAVRALRVDPIEVIRAE